MRGEALFELFRREIVKNQRLHELWMQIEQASNLDQMLKGI